MYVFICRVCWYSITFIVFDVIPFCIYFIQEKGYSCLLLMYVSTILISRAGAQDNIPSGIYLRLMMVSLYSLLFLSFFVNFWSIFCVTVTIILYFCFVTFNYHCISIIVDIYWIDLDTSFIEWRVLLSILMVTVYTQLLVIQMVVPTLSNGMLNWDGNRIWGRYKNNNFCTQR